MENFYLYLRNAGLEVKPYQEEGVKWCLNNEDGYTIHEKLVKGGFLADEMGLGKTIQMIGTIMSNIAKYQRTLIVVPRALLEQWNKVFIETSGHRPLIYHNSRQGKLKNISEEELAEAPIVLTTYGMITPIKDKKNPALTQETWDRVIFDEAHHLRTKNTLVHKGAMMIRAEIRWIVTGTPIQNKKEDFYSLCRVMGLPSTYYTETENLPDLARKFLLKRTKESVGLHLPSLNQTNIEIEWETEEEKELAENIHSNLAFSGLTKPMSIDGMEIIARGALPMLLRARQACIYPPLMKGHMYNLINEGLLEETEIVEKALNASSKINSLVNHIIERKDNKNNKLIFCHFRGEIDIIKKELSRHEINVETFDGRVKQKKREEILSSDCEVLILQIKTGCEGLNLQKFNEVYFVSPHWNPAVEEQAIARCHRLGQKKDIHVFHFNMAGFGEDSEAITLDTYASSVQDEKRDIMKLLN